MKWGQRKPRNDEEPLTVRFSPGGGFHRRGAFTESGSRAEYEFPEFVTIEALADNLHHQRQWGLGWGHPRTNEAGEFLPTDGQVLIGRAVLQPSTHGQYSLSFLGSSRRHTVLDLAIHRGPGRYAVLVGLPATDPDDIDLSWDEHFAVDVRLEAAAFDQLAEAFRADPHQAIKVAMRLDDMPGLYATWSPSVSNGRTLKVLDRDSDVSNLDDVPQGFDARTMQHGLPFCVTLVRKTPEDSSDD